MKDESAEVFWYTANIYSLLLCPVSTVVLLYGLHLIPYAVQGRSYCKTRFKTKPKPLNECFFGLEQVQTSLYKFKQV